MLFPTALNKLAGICSSCGIYATTSNWNAKTLPNWAFVRGQLLLKGSRIQSLPKDTPTGWVRKRGQWKLYTIKTRNGTLKLFNLEAVDAKARNT